MQLFHINMEFVYVLNIAKFYALVLLGLLSLNIIINMLLFSGIRWSVFFSCICFIV